MTATEPDAAMDLYFAPLACSMASRILAYEAGAPLGFVRVDTRAKRVVDDGSDFLAVNSKGQVPALRRDDGSVLTENPAVLQHLARAWPEARLAPTDPGGEDALRSWLNFISSEVHAGAFTVLLTPESPKEAKAWALHRLREQYDHLQAHLADREFLLDGGFSVADAYLFVVLNWTRATPLSLADWPAVTAYHARLASRPSFARAMAEELPMYQAA